MQNQIIERAGSDASFDLIIEAISPRPPEGYELQVNDRSQVKKSNEILDKLLPHFDLAEKDWGLRVSLFERFPDGWIWQSRVESIVDKMRMHD